MPILCHACHTLPAAPTPGPPPNTRAPMFQATRLARVHQSRMGQNGMPRIRVLLPLSAPLPLLVPLRFSANDLIDP